MNLSWIGDIPDGIWIALVTGGFLLGQQVLTNRREDRRRTEDREQREKDRTHAAGLADAERAAIVAERWREDRKEAYAEFIAAADEVLRTAFTFSRLATRPNSSFTQRLLSEIAEGVGGRCTKAYATLILLASDSANTEGDRLLKSLRVLEANAFDLISDSEPAPETQLITFRNLRATAQTARQHFVTAARSDLGTT